MWEREGALEREMRDLNLWHSASSMVSRRRKKPPDLTTFSLQSIPCLPHHPPSDLLYPSVYHLPQTFASGQRFGLICGSCRNFARSRDGMIVDLLWVATNLACGCNYTFLYCTSSWPTPFGRRSCAACLRPKVWTAFSLHRAISRSRNTLRYGQGAMGGCIFYGSCEVWLFLSVLFWVSLLMGLIAILFRTIYVFLFLQLLPLLYGWLIMKWMHIFHIMFHPCYIGCCLFDPVYFSLSLPLTLCVHAGRNFLTSSSFSSLLVRGYNVSMALIYRLIRVFMCYLRPAHHGKLFLNFVMKPWSLNSELGVELVLHWVLPSFLLSLCLVSLYAQNHVIAYSCWHLHFFQTARDEVKGLYPLAYEDFNTEANLILSLLLFFPHLFALCIFCFWPLVLLQMFWKELQDLLARPFCDVFTPILRLDYHAKGEVVQLRMMQTPSFGLQIVNLYLLMLVQYWSITHPFLWIFLLRMYCSHMTVLDHIKCITDDTVSVPSGCISFIVVSCNRYFVSDFE